MSSKNKKSRVKKRAANNQLKKDLQENTFKSPKIPSEVLKNQSVLNSEKSLAMSNSDNNLSSPSNAPVSLEKNVSLTHEVPGNAESKGQSSIPKTSGIAEYNNTSGDGYDETRCNITANKSTKPESDTVNVTKNHDTVYDEGDFISSLNNFSEKDIQITAPVKMKKGIDVFQILLLAICIGVFAISSVLLIQNVYSKYKSEQIYNGLIDRFGDGFDIDGSDNAENGIIKLLSLGSQAQYTPTMEQIIREGITQTSQNQTEKSYEKELQKMRASLESLANINPDIYGWINIPGTSINYPVVQGEDNDYYLDHAYTGDDLVNGSIFADFRCLPLITDNYNTIMYGHNITSGSMFNNIEYFFDEEFFKNTKIYIYTFDGAFIFTPFSIHETSYDSGYINTYFESEEVYVDFLNDLMEKSAIMPENKKFSGDTRILTMSTCTNGIQTKRYALHAELTTIISDK